MRPMAGSSSGGTARAGGASMLVLTSTLALCLLTAADARRGTQSKPAFKLFRTRLIPKIYKFEHCTDREHAFRVANVSTLMNHDGSESVDVFFNILSTIKSVSMMKVGIHRCTGSTSSCETFNNWRFTNNLCDLMQAKRMVWTPYMQMIKPNIKCPIESGPYMMHNVTVDLDMVDRMMPGLSLDKYIWLSECQTFDENRDLFSCFRWTTEAHRVRIKADGILNGLPGRNIMSNLTV
ncbi:hypothetical protein ONE63_006464 [Megalurothrips usitatus]|uniref:Uncharacterized protein n=1 Tax=Megalurothrips usitatus TaxID=439358 RepID=A0AAV7Y0C7_9NEOP|nr:hypothetical protein ONE63_006464 [Megalurothrips usitatus]